ncbi:unnamed protein product [Sphagnum balticum]
MIDLTLEGATSTALPAATGVVQSPEPYHMARVTAHLNRAIALANQYKVQMETNALLGSCTVYTDAPGDLGSYTLDVMAISGIDRLQFNGRDAGWVITFTGQYNVNASYWQ